MSVERRLALAILVFALIGTAEAAYLTYAHYANLKVACPNSGCDTVQHSVYATLAGLPVALLGLIGYVTILGTLALRGELARAAGFTVALIGFGFSMYLTYREVFTIHAICYWCVGSAVLMTVLMILTGVRFLRAPAA